MDEYERKLKYVGYCGCCQKDWESIKEMTEHVLTLTQTSKPIIKDASSLEMSEITLLRHHCGRLVYWALKDPTQPESEVNKKIPHWPAGGMHHCFGCGAAGYDTAGCGTLVIPLWHTKVIDGKTFKFQVLYNADGQAARRHHCKYVKALQDKEKGNWPDLFLQQLEEEGDEIEWPDKDFVVSASAEPKPEIQIRRASDIYATDRQIERIQNELAEDLRTIRQQLEALKDALKKFFPSFDL